MANEVTLFLLYFHQIMLFHLRPVKRKLIYLMENVLHLRIFGDYINR
jgi:hypothetical protein